ncbi:MAG: ATPase [Tannerellaceae bacterium]|nr:ATPase [Tannerellaceae bacterium]
MIIIADGGSTKVDWRFIEEGIEVGCHQTEGINPYFRNREEITLLLKEQIYDLLKGRTPEGIYFYGAGCTHTEINDSIRFALYDSLNCNQVEVYSDLWGAARGLCGTTPGIACILGTGSNSCYYNGKEIVNNVSPLGYILGDEGSGAVLGKLFIGACLKNQLTSGIKEEFLDSYQLTATQILEKVYKQPNPNRFLAGFSPFILEHLTDPSVRELVHKTFTGFFTRNVMQYDYRNSIVHLTGSVAYHYREVLKDVAASLQIQTGHITQSPMEGLIRYHTGKCIKPE